MDKFDFMNIVANIFEELHYDEISHCAEKMKNIIDELAEQYCEYAKANIK